MAARRQFWLSWSIVVLCVGIEFCMTLWCAAAAARPDRRSAGRGRDRCHRDRGRHVRRPAARRTAGRPARRRLVLSPGVRADRGRFRAVLVQRVAVAVVPGLALCGLGMAVHYPLGIARAIRRRRRRAARRHGPSDLAAPASSLGTGFAIGLAPFLLGFLADMSASGTRSCWYPRFSRRPRRLCSRPAGSRDACHDQPESRGFAAGRHYRPRLVAAILSSRKGYAK